MNKYYQLILVAASLSTACSQDFEQPAQIERIDIQSTVQNAINTKDVAEMLLDVGIDQDIGVFLLKEKATY